MAALITKTLARGVLVISAVLCTIFFVGYAIGDPARLAVPLGSSDAVYQQARHQLGLDRPLSTQFLDFAHRVVTGNLGDSLWQHQPALSVALHHLPATMLLLLVSTLISLIVSFILAIVSVLNRGRAVEKVINSLASIGAATPPFWVGLCLVLLFAVKWHTLPTGGSEGRTAVILPAMSLSIASMGRLTQTIRGYLLSEDSRPYARLAMAKGLAPMDVIERHTLRNAGVPIATYFLWEVVRLLTGASVVVEVVFAWPGIGQLAIQAVQHQDFTLVEACVVVISVLVVLINMTAEILYAAVDPRLRTATRVRAGVS